MKKVTVTLELSAAEALVLAVAIKRSTRNTKDIFNDEDEELFDHVADVLRAAVHMQNPVHRYTSQAVQKLA